ncbi:MAG: TolB-like 6-bladed beta-propeller domain-containing protein [Prevotellaceae bacterium]|jgi:hypothetical protein|nr:TolB-like 6-bladed beta-propeller domain-containing protein [Prevotellaceae bacterium]
MKYKKILFAAILGSMLYSCTSNKNADDLFLEKSIKSDAKFLQADTIGFFEDLIYARDFHVYQDSILIVRNRKYEDVYFLEFYNLPQGKLLKKMFRLGNGPNEMLSAKIEINGNLLTAVDYVKDQVALVNIDSVLQDSLYQINPNRYYTHSPTVVQYKENQYLVLNPHCFKDRELGIDNKASRFIVTSKKNIYVEKNEYRYYTWNVVANGLIITNYQKNIIAFAPIHRPEIEIYDDDLTLLKHIHGPDKLPPNYRIVNDFDNNEILFKKDYIPYTYLNYCTNEDFFYLTYMGDYLHPSKGENMEDYPLWVFKFDWNGNFIGSYFLGRYVSSISLSADGKSFYATAISEEKNPFLIKFAIK